MNERTDDNGDTVRHEPEAPAAPALAPPASDEAFIDEPPPDLERASDPDPADELAQAAAAAGGPPALGAPPVRRGRRPAIVWLVVLAAAAVLAVAYGPRFLRRVAELRNQRACAEHAPPATLVAYEERPDKAAALLKAGGGHAPIPLPPGAERGGPVAGEVPNVWREYRRWALPASPEPRGALLFLHERQTAVGVRGVLAVEADRVERRLRVTFIYPGTFTSAPTPVTNVVVKAPPKEGMIVLSAGRDPFESKLPEGDDPAARSDLRFFAGQPDPQDWTHLVIPYEHNGDGGELELWVIDESTVHYVDRRFAR
jgi:hypothetical protein